MENTKHPNSPETPNAELSAELARHRNQLRDYEKALVERIADVDDDRRATASRLQRAWQTQREEVDDRLRRHAGLMAGLLLLFAVLVAIALFLVYRQARTEQSQIAGQVAEMRQELGLIGESDTFSNQLKGELARLNADVEAIASSLKRRNKSDTSTDREAAAKGNAGEEGDSRVAEEMRHLEVGQARLSAQVESLRATLEAVQVARSAAPAPQAASEPGIGDSRNEVPVGGTMPAEAANLDIAGTAENGEADTAGPGAYLKSDVPTSGETRVAGEGSYALQLIGFFDRDSLAAFAARDGLPARVYYIRQTHKGRPWYALVHSLHEGYAAAAEELSRLPADLVALSPWIRPVPAGTELRILRTGPNR